MYLEKANVMWLNESDKTRTNVIYALVFPDNKMYIGQTCCKLGRRIKDHSILSNNPKTKKEKAIKQFREFKVLILDTFKLSETWDNDLKERYWIKKFDSFNNGYNGNDGGVGIRS